VEGDVAQHFALADYAPKRDLQAGSPLSGSSSAGERPNRNQIAASLLLHLLVLLGLFLLPQALPVEVVVPLVTLRIEESGAAGSAGGKAGGGGGGGHGTEASSAPTQEKKAAVASEPKEATAEPTPPEPTPPEPTPPEPTPPEPTPPEPTPPEPTPPTPTPPTPDASPLPPAPQALAPKPKPPPRPAVKPRPVKPVPVKSAETPTPPAVAEPPPGPGNGEGPPTQNPQPGTAATGTANAGPGGATGVGTGAGGAGRGSCGDGRGLGDDYLDRLRRHLAKYKHFPPEAVKLKEEGTALVEFVLARDGTVLEAHIQRSSGFPLLDQATLEMIRNASPVPKVPDRFVGDRVSIAIPTGFKIGLFDKLF
jgi:protein TonB